MTRVLSALIVSLAVMLSAGAGHAQTRYGASVYVQATSPTATTGTTLGSLWWDTSTSTLNVLTSLSPAVWTAIGIGSTSAGLPSGMIAFMATGTCPTGWTEVAGLNGRVIRGTVAANGNVGTTGGSDTFTPAGTVAAPVFTGNSVTSSAVSAGTPAGTNGTSATSGNCAATNIAAGTGSTTACKATAPNLTVSAQTFTGSALGTHTHTTTSTGSNSAPAFTGAQATVIPAFELLIGCSKN